MFSSKPVDPPPKGFLKLFKSIFELAYDAFRFPTSLVGKMATKANDIVVKWPT